MGVALFVGVVFVYQVIASDIANRLGEYATLKAMGYGPMYLASVVMQQAAFIAALGYLPGLIGSLLLYARGPRHYRRADRHELDAGRAGVRSHGGDVLGLGLPRPGKVQSADPAELF